MLQSSRWFRPLALSGWVALLALNASDASAGLLAYDSFEVGPGGYLAGDDATGTNVLAGQSPAIGPTPFYSGGWIQSGGDAQAVKDIGSLQYPLFPHSGGQVQESLQFSCCTFGRSGREIADALGRETRTIYQSFLIDFGTQGTDDPTQFGKRAYEMWNGGVGDSFLAVDLFFNHFAGVNQLTLSVTTASGTQSQIVGGGLSLNDLAGTNLFVLKFDFSALAADVVTAYLNPTDSIESNYTPAASVAAPNSDLFITHHGTISQFTFSGAGHLPGAFDEVRWGDTFADVTPFLSAEVPEPETVGLFGMALGLLALARRRK